MKISALAWLGGIALAGCSTDRASVDPGGAMTELLPSGARLAVFAALSTGGEPADGRFAHKQDVYFDARLLVPPTLLVRPTEPRDFYFEVRDAAGTVLSTDAIGCRKVTIDGTGRILNLFDGSASGVLCTHDHALDVHGGGGLTIALAPYADSSMRVGQAAAYTLVLAPVKDFAGFGDTALSAPFLVDLPKVPEPVCGNGVLEPGEACDGGEGCTESCTTVVEPPPDASTARCVAARCGVRQRRHGARGGVRRRQPRPVRRLQLALPDRAPVLLR